METGTPNLNPPELPPHLRELQRQIQARELEAAERQPPPVKPVPVPALSAAVALGLAGVLVAPFIIAYLLPPNFVRLHPALAIVGLGPGFAATLVGFIFLRLRLVRNALDRKRTLQTTGLITDFDLEKTPTRRGGYAYRAVVRFQYEHAGLSYEQDYRPMEAFHNMMKKHEATKSRLAPGSAVTVRFDPGEPHSAALGEPVTGAGWPALLYALGILMLGGTVFLLVASILR